MTQSSSIKYLISQNSSNKNPKQQIPIDKNTHNRKDSEFKFKKKKKKFVKEGVKVKVK